MRLLMLASLVALAWADGSSQPASTSSDAYQQTASHGEQYQILSQQNVHPGDGTYQFSFRTENGIERDESKVDYGQQGAWSYTDDYGNAVQLTFTADENGYQPVSDVLPTPVPTEYPVPVVPQVYQGEQSYGRAAPAPAPARYSPAPAPTLPQAIYNPTSTPAPEQAYYSPSSAPVPESTPAPAHYSSSSASASTPADTSYRPDPTLAPAHYRPAPAHVRNRLANARAHIRAPTHYNAVSAPTLAPSRHRSTPAAELTPAPTSYNSPAPTSAPIPHSLPSATVRHGSAASPNRGRGRYVHVTSPAPAHYETSPAPATHGSTPAPSSRRHG